MVSRPADDGLDPDRIGVVGGGMIGSAVARALVPHHPVTVQDPSAEARQHAEEFGARAVRQLAEHGTPPIVLLALPGPDQVREVVAELLTAERRPLVVVDHSTIDPDTTREVAALAAEHDVGHLDAPILGRPHRVGEWTLPVGGDAATLARVRGVLELLARRVVHVGPIGSGNVVKLLNNLMFGAINAITVETMATAARLGLDPAVYAETIADSGAASVSGLFRELAPKIVAEDHTPTFSVDLLTKDNQLAVEMARAAGIRLDVAEAVLALDRAAQAAGLGALDTSAMVQLFGDGAG